MKHFFPLFVLIFSIIYSPLMFAQTASEAFISMPDDIIPYLYKEHRVALIENGGVPTLLDGLCVIDTITATCVKVETSEKSTFTLVCDTTEARIYTLVTVSAPESETLVKCYSADWQLIGRCEIDITLDQLICDTLNRDARAECLKFADVFMRKVDYCLEDDCLVVTPTFIAMNSDDKKLTNERFVSKKLQFCNVKVRK